MFGFITFHHLPRMSQLPESLQSVAEVIGEAAALHLAANWPRTVCQRTGRGRAIVYVPVKLPDAHPLIDLIGQPAAAALVTHFAGDLLFLASGTYKQAHERREAIAQAVRGGLSRESVARVFGVSDTTIKRALRASVAIPALAVRADHAGTTTRN